MSPSRHFLFDSLFLLAVAVLSFLYFGLPFYRFLDSDMAVHVYMSESFSFRYNLYFWHQDRLGSIVPMTGHVLYKVFNLAPVWACALAEYLYLVIGCYAFWCFIPLRWQKWMFTVLWFFPAFEMTLLVMPAHPYGEQLAFTALSLVCFDRYLDDQRPAFYLPLFLAFALMAIWISDFSAVFYLVLPFFFYRRIHTVIPGLFRATQRTTLALSSLVVAVGISLIIYAKNHTARDETYIGQMFANGEQFRYTISLLWYYVYQVVTFQSVSWLNSLMFYSILGSIVLVLFVKRWREPLSPRSKYLLATSLVSLLVLSSLRWVSINFVMLKYFIPVFIFAWVGLFSIKTRRGFLPNLFYTVLMILSVGAATGSNIWMHSRQQRAITNLERLKKIRELKPKAFIGNYWSSYVLGIADPSAIAATPHEDDTWRNAEMIERVITHDTVYFVKNDWLDVFPDSIGQYGYTWIKAGNEITVDSFIMAPYRKKK